MRRALLEKRRNALVLMRVDGKIETAQFAEQSQSVRDEPADFHLLLSSRDRTADETPALRGEDLCACA